jgi:predicted Zn-dependent protease
MLEKLNLERIFTAARQRGFSHCEIFAEETLNSEIEIQGRRCETLIYEEFGISVALKNAESQHLLTTNTASTESLIALIEQTGEVFETGFDSPTPRKSFSEKLAEKTRALQVALRKTGQTEKDQRALYREKVRTFETCCDPDAIKSGQEEDAVLNLSYSIHHRGKSKIICENTARKSIAALWNEVKQEGRFPLLRQPPSWHTPWPAPAGEVTVHWSSRAVAKFLLHFLRAFEGDLFLRQLSFLGDLENPVNLNFNVEETPISQTEVDHEGTARKTVSLWENGLPANLFCDLRTASLLKRSATGHARRESFLHPPIVGFWNSKLTGKSVEPALLKRVDSGLSIEDVEIIDFDLITGQISFILSDGVLVHHGEPGEAIEPLKIKCSLMSLLESFEVFSLEHRTWGLELTKKGQSFLSEFTTPDALSLKFPIPGSVPPDHYW